MANYFKAIRFICAKMKHRKSKQREFYSEKQKTLIGKCQLLWEFPMNLLAFRFITYECRMWLTGARQWLPPRLKQGVFCFGCTGVKNPDGANSRNARVRNYYDYISRKSLPTLSISHSLFSSLFLPSGPVGLREHVQPFYLSSSDALFLAHSGARFYPLTFRPFCCTPYLKPWNGHSRVYSVTRIAGRILPHKLPTHSDGELKKKKTGSMCTRSIKRFFKSTFATKIRKVLRERRLSFPIKSSSSSATKPAHPWSRNQRETCESETHEKPISFFRENDNEKGAIFFSFFFIDYETVGSLSLK